MRKYPLILAVNLIAISSNVYSSDDTHLKNKANACLSASSIKDAQRCLIENNSPFARAYLDESGQLRLATSPSNIIGDYSDYVTDMDDLGSPLLLKALEADGKKLSVKMGQVDKSTGRFNAHFISTDDGSPLFNGAVVASNLGPDISGRDILSWFNRYRIGDGYTLTSSVSHGFSDLRPESKGGQYETAYLSLEKVTPYGLFDIDYTYAKSLSGGEARLYELGGTTQRTSLNARHWINNTISFSQGLELTQRQQDFGSFGIDENQQYLSYTPSLKAEGDLGSLSLSAKKGVSGIRDFDLVPLMGSFNPHYWSATIDAHTEGRLADTGFSYNAALKGFSGSIDMPSSERLGLGGSGAGSSHESGLYSGHEGYHYSTGVSYPLLNSNSPVSADVYANINGGSITTATKDNIKLSAAEFGGTLTYAEWVVQTSYSRSIKTQNLDDDQRISAKIIWRY